MINISQYEFHGYDWTELADCWDIAHYNKSGRLETELSEEEITEQIIDYMWEHYEDKEMLDDLKRFIEALVWMGDRYEFYEYPVWKSFLEIKNDITFIKFCAATLRLMWT